MRRFIYAVATLASVLGASSQARAEYLLWTDNGNFGSGGNKMGDIRRANLDGSNQTTLISGLTGPNDVAANPVDGMMYWVDGREDTTTGDIRRANLDGSNPLNDLARVV